MRPSWGEYALAMAHAAASRSQDLDYKVGCVVLRADHSIASVGYNGAPSGVELDWGNREARRPYVIHAEQNALRWTTPTDVAGGLLAVNYHPCARCLLDIAAYHISQVWFSLDLDWSVYNRRATIAVAHRVGVTLTRGATP